MSIARDQLSTTMLDYGECSESVILQFKEPIVIIERSGPLQEGHWLELHSEYCKWLRERARYSPHRFDIVQADGRQRIGRRPLEAAGSSTATPFLSVLGRLFGSDPPESSARA